MWLFLAFLAVPLIEIGLFIQIGGWLGLWPTLLIVVITALLGTALVRQQGALALTQVRGSFENLNDPTEPLAHGGECTPAKPAPAVLRGGQGIEPIGIEDEQPLERHQGLCPGIPRPI